MSAPVFAAARRWGTPGSTVAREDQRGAAVCVVVATSDTKTDSINRAIQVYAYLEEVTARGGAIYVREPGDPEPEKIKIF